VKIVTVLGARPQFIKAGTVSREIEKRRSDGHGIEEIIVHTGQHYDANMSDIFFDEMRIPRPDHSLEVNARSHGAMTGRMIEGIEEILTIERPDLTLVYGDTNSTLAGAIAAAKMHIPIAHVEAGLRSFNMEMPEEVNRILTDRISRWLFCPTKAAMDNLKREGIHEWNNGSEAFTVGDVMLDGALFYKEFALKPDGVPDGDFVLCTIHRAENTDKVDRLAEIVRAISEIASERTVVLPMHPRTRKRLQETGLELANATIIEPVGYLNMVWLIDNSNLIITDSGGLQKEACFFSKPCLTLRDETEWVELVDAGVNVLCGADCERILAAYEKTFGGESARFDQALELYGHGDAASRLLTELAAG